MLDTLQNPLRLSLHSPNDTITLSEIDHPQEGHVLECHYQDKIYYFHGDRSTTKSFRCDGVIYLDLYDAYAKQLINGQQLVDLLNISNLFTFKQYVISQRDKALSCFSRTELDSIQVPYFHHPDLETEAHHILHTSQEILDTHINYMIKHQFTRMNASINILSYLSLKDDTQEYNVDITEIKRSEEIIGGYSLYLEHHHDTNKNAVIEITVLKSGKYQVTHGKYNLEIDSLRGLSTALNLFSDGLDDMHHLVRVGLDELAHRFAMVNSELVMYSVSDYRTPSETLNIFINRFIELSKDASVPEVDVDEEIED